MKPAPLSLKCWKNFRKDPHHPTKMKNGHRVNNCIPCKATKPKK